MKKWLLKPPSQDDLIQVLQAWRVWLLVTFVGALLGNIIYYVVPPIYRASATVTVDHDLEQAWPYVEAERFLMTYLSRETQKLIEVAWEDATLQSVVDQNPGTSISELRSGVLRLSQAADGAWHFWADNSDADKASSLAISWASAFYERALYGIEIAIQLQAAQAALLQNPSDIDSLNTKISKLEKESLGINPYLQINLSQVQQIPIKRTIDSSVFIMGGAVISWVFTLLGLFLKGTHTEDRGSL